MHNDNHGLLSTAFAIKPEDTINSKSFNIKLFEKLIFLKVNEYQSKNGLKRQRQDSRIYAIAEDQIDFLMRKTTDIQLTSSRKSDASKENGVILETKMIHCG